eukprot:3756536-Pyramimonas_sp.AAC.1
MQASKNASHDAWTERHDKESKHQESARQLRLCEAASRGLALDNTSFALRARTHFYLEYLSSGIHQRSLQWEATCLNFHVLTAWVPIGTGGLRQVCWF